MATTEQPAQATQALLNTLQAVFSQHLDGKVVQTVFEADGNRDFILVSDVLWELLPEVSTVLGHASASSLLTYWYYMLVNLEDWQHHAHMPTATAGGGFNCFGLCLPGSWLHGWFQTVAGLHIHVLQHTTSMHNFHMQLSTKRS
jgi:hypothetical protein